MIIARPIAAVLVLLLSAQHLAAQTQLPSGRLNGGGSSVLLSTYYTFWPSYPQIDDTDQAANAHITLAYEDVSLFFYDASYGYAEPIMSAEASVSADELESDWNPTVDTSLQTLSEIEAFANPNDEIGGYFWEYADVYSNATFQILENPNSPGTGTVDDSATLTASLWFVLSGQMAGQVNNPLSFSVSVGTSSVTITTLDWTGTTWGATGSLSQSSSVNPTASPDDVSDSFLDGFNELYVGTQAADVGDQITLIAHIDIPEILVAVSESGTSSALHQQSMKASGWYEVDVP